MREHLPKRTPIHAPQTAVFQKLCFYSNSHKSSLYRWVLKRDVWDTGEDTWRYRSDDRSFCWKNNGSKNGILFWRKRCRTGIMGAESIGKEISAFLAAQLPDRCDFPSASGKRSTTCKKIIKRFVLHDCTCISKGLKMISWPTAVITHNLWALWLCSQKHWMNIFHHSSLAAIVGWK